MPDEVVVRSMYGVTADWLRDIEASPAVLVETAANSYAPRQRFLTAHEAVDAVRKFKAKHPLQS